LSLISVIKGSFFLFESQGRVNIAVEWFRRNWRISDFVIVSQSAHPR